MSNTPHDALVKAILGQPEHAANALRSIVPAELSDALDWSGLRRENASYVSVDGGSRHSDLVFAVPLRAAPGAPPREALVYVLLEHQSTPDPLMALRLFVYVARLFEERVLRPGLARAPLVVSVVLSHTERPWVGALSLEELYDAPADLVAALGPLIPRLAYTLEDMTSLSDEAIASKLSDAVVRTTWTVLRDARSVDDLYAYAVKLRDLFFAMRRDGPALLSLFEYLVQTNDADAITVHKVIALMPPEAQEDIVTAFDRIRAEAKAEGRAEVQAEADARARRTVLAKLLQLKFGALSDDVRARLDAADEPTLDLWTERVLFATTLDAIFAA